MNHTPGPWNIGEPWAGFADIRDAAGDLVFAIAYPSLGLKDKARPSEECWANARLIAAAPDLLEQLKTAAIITPHNRFNARSPCDPLCARCKFDAAIAKAEGK